MLINSTVVHDMFAYYFSNYNVLIYPLNIPLQLNPFNIILLNNYIHAYRNSLFVIMLANE
jgi:hypothetical protein